MDYILETEDKEIKGIEISDEVKEKAMGSIVVDKSLSKTVSTALKYFQ